MNKQTFLALIILVVISANIRAQSDFLNGPDAWLGQKTPSDTPLIFAQSLLTAKDTFPLDRVAFSPDGKEFYYPTNNTWYNTENAKIRYFTYDRKKWNGPFILNEHYYAPTFSPDGSTLYFLGGKGDSVHFFVWQSKRKHEGWTEPSVYLKKDYGLYDFMPTTAGASYVASNAHGGNINDFNTYDICEFRISGKDTTIKSLGAPLNTPGFDGDFFVAKDASYIIISANETKDFECELHISFHNPDQTWTKPVSLGPLINNGIAHRWGQYVTPDGQYLFYSQGTSPKDCHIYWVRFNHLLKKLKPAG